MYKGADCETEEKSESRKSQISMALSRRKILRSMICTKVLIVRLKKNQSLEKVTAPWL